MKFLFLLFFRFENFFFLMEQRGYKPYGFGWMVSESQTRFFMCKIAELTKFTKPEERILGSPPKVPFSFQFSLTNLRAVYFILSMNKWPINGIKKKKMTQSLKMHTAHWITITKYNNMLVEWLSTNSSIKVGTFVVIKKQ